MRACVLFAVVAALVGSPAMAQETSWSLSAPEREWEVQDLPAIPPHFEPEDSWSINQDNNRLGLRYEGMTVAVRTRDVYCPSDGACLRYETIHLGRVTDDGPRFALWRLRERQDIPGGPKATSYGIALVLQF